MHTHVHIYIYRKRWLDYWIIVGSMWVLRIFGLLHVYPSIFMVTCLYLQHSYFHGATCLFAKLASIRELERYVIGVCILRLYAIHCHTYSYDNRITCTTVIHTHAERRWSKGDASERLLVTLRREHRCHLWC